MLNGALVGRFQLPPFIVTLGTMGLARGITLGLTSGAPVRDLPGSFRQLGQGVLTLGGLSLPLPVLWMLLLAALVSLLLHQTVLGRYIYAVGGDERALLSVGVPAGRVKLLAYILSGLLAAIGGIVMTAKLGVAAPTAAGHYGLLGISERVALLEGRLHVQNQPGGGALIQVELPHPRVDVH